MSIDVEQACGILEEFLEDPSRTRKVKEAIEVAIGSQQIEALQLVTDSLFLMPDAIHLGPLKELVASASASEEARVEAVRSVATILDVAASRLTQGGPETEPVLSQDEIDKEINYLLDIHRRVDYPTLVRKKALENAASLTNAPAIHEAGKAALASGDPTWVATGLYVIRQCDPANALKTLGQYLTNSDAGVRVEAIQGYAQLGRKAHYKRLADMIYTSKGESQVLMLAALAEVPRKKAGDLLWETAEWMDGEAGVQANAAYRRWVETVADTAPEEPDDSAESDVLEEEPAAAPIDEAKEAQKETTSESEAARQQKTSEIRDEAD